MLPTGHIAVSYLLHRYAGVDLRIVVLAALFPDILDKPLKLVFHLVEGGRSWGHGLPLLLLLSLGIWMWWGKRAGYSWCMGHLFHLLADYPLSWNVPWFFPFVDYEMAATGPPILITWPEVVFDLGAVLLGGVVYWRMRRSGETGWVRTRG